MQTIEHEIKINATLQDVYNALTTIRGLEGWHTAAISGDSNLHGMLQMNATGKADFIWKVIDLKNNSEVQWECIKGPGDSVGSKVSFKLLSLGNKHVVVECEHDGWPGRDGNFRKCNTLWGILMWHLKKYVETGIAQPAFN